MATYNLTQWTEKHPHHQQHTKYGAVVVSATFNGVDATKKKGSALAVNDVFELLTIPAGAFVHTVTHQVTTVEGSTCTYAIGDGTATAGYVAAVTGNAATNASSFNATTTPSLGVGKYYAAADTIDLLLASGTAANVVIKVSATYFLTAPQSA